MFFRAVAGDAQVRDDWKCRILGEADRPFGDLFDLIDDQAGFGEQSQFDFLVTSNR